MFHNLQLHSRLFLLSVFTMVVAQGAFAATVVIPNAQTSVEANESNAFPFGRTLTSKDPYRYQQVYNASGFGEQAAPITIDEIRFRPDSNNFFATAITVQSVQVWLSTTDAVADELDNVTFDNNIGTGASLVHSGELIWPMPTITAEPRPFELVIRVRPRFEYDPSAGNLLLEVYNNSASFPVGYTLDLEEAVDETSRVVETVIPGTNTHEIAAIPAGTSRGLVTQFVYNTPEPGTLGTGIAALLALAALRRPRIA